MASLADKIKYLKETIELIKENFATHFGLSCSTIRELANRIPDISITSGAWQIITDSGEDALGSFTLKDGVAGAVSMVSTEILTSAGYYRLKNGVKIRTGEEQALPQNNVVEYLVSNLSSVSIPSIIKQCGAAYDLSASDYVDVKCIINGYGSYYKGNSVYSYNCCFPIGTKRLLLSKSFQYYPYVLFSTEYMSGGLYLSATSHNRSSSWIFKDSSSVEIPVKNPPKSDEQYYLNKIGISADDMVGIFENMIDRSANTTTKTITLGTTNLAKLTEEQKEIAYKKGWNLA